MEDFRWKQKPCWYIFTFFDIYSNNSSQEWVKKHWCIFKYKSLSYDVNSWFSDSKIGGGVSFMIWYREKSHFSDFHTNRKSTQYPNTTENYYKLIYKYSSHNLQKKKKKRAEKWAYKRNNMDLLSNYYYKIQFLCSRK